MNQLGKPLVDGLYVLNSVLSLTIKQNGTGMYLKMDGAKPIKITTSIQEGNKWRIWYLINDTERSATIERVPEV